MEKLYDKLLIELYDLLVLKEIIVVDLIEEILNCI